MDYRSIYKAFTVVTTAAPVPPPTTRILTSTALVYHNPSWGSGGQFDQTINVTATLPSGCAVTLRQAHLQCPDGMGNWIDCSNTINEIVGVYGSRGFVIDQLFGNPTSLKTTVRLHHNGWEGIAVRVKYTVTQPAGVSCQLPGVAM